MQSFHKRISLLYSGSGSTRGVKTFAILLYRNTKSKIMRLWTYALGTYFTSRVALEVSTQNGYLFKVIDKTPCR